MQPLEIVAGTRVTLTAAPVIFYAPGATATPCSPSQHAGAVLGGHALMVKWGGAAGRTPLSPVAPTAAHCGRVALRLAAHPSSGLHTLQVTAVLAPLWAASQAPPLVYALNRLGY